MIYGRINSGSLEILKAQFSDLNELMKWRGCIHHTIEWGDFSGGFMYDPNLPYQFDDFYFLDQEEDLMVLMSGVIYNHDEISKRLFLRGTKIHAPQLVQAAFSSWGEDFVKELIGDFTIYIYQKNTNNSYIYRDQIGIRPMAISKKNDTIFFSSDYLALCKALYGNEAVDQQFLLNYLINYGMQSTNMVPECTQLPNKKVHQILPGHYYNILNSVLREKKYWNPEDIKEENNLDFETVTRELKCLLENAVKIRSDLRFSAAAHLSGGLDSGIVASLAKKAYEGQQEFPGFCWTPDSQSKESKDFDERVLVKKLGELTGISPIFTNFDSRDYINFLSEWRAGTDLCYEFKVRETGRQKNINLIFSGWGGDEFVSYSNFGIDSDLVFKFQWRSFFKKNPVKNPKRLIAVLLYNVILPALSLKYFSRKRPLAFYSKYHKIKSQNKSKTLNDFYSWRSRKEMHLRYLYQYHIPERTADWYINGSRAGIEYRYPLIDKRIIEFMLKVPSRLLFKNGYSRILIREICEGLLPEEVRWNTSKNDPDRLAALFELWDNACVHLMDEVEIFRNNPVLCFIDFDLLMKDIAAYRNGLIKSRPSKSFEILLFLKKAHEFTKAYST